MKLDKFFILLLAVFLIYSAAVSLIIKNNKSLSTVDAPNHAIFCLQFYEQTAELFKNPDIGLLEKMRRSKDIFGEGIIYWPKFVYLTSFPLMYFIKPIIDAIKFTNLFYLFLLMVFSYLLTLKLGGEKNEGFLAAVLIPLYPFVFKSISSYGLDLPLTAIVVVFLYFLLKTEGFKNTLYSILSGLILGIASLIKGQVFLFVLAPLIVYFLDSVIREIRKKKDLVSIFAIFVNLALFIIFSFQIGSLWWRGKFDEISSSFQEHIGSKNKYLESFPCEVYGSLRYYLFYFKYLFLKGLRPLFAVVTGILFLRYILVFKGWAKKILLIWILVPFLLFSVLFEVHQLRFIMPIMPAVGIITVLGTRFRKNILTFSARSIILFLACLQLFVVFSGSDKRYLRSLFGFGGDFILKKESLNSRMAEDFINEFKKYFPEGAYKIIIMRFAGMEDGPLGLQFWLENKGYQEGYRIMTHDLFDQWDSVYEWLSEKGEYIILFVWSEEFNFNHKNLWGKSEILKMGRRCLSCFEEFRDSPHVKKLLNEILPVVKRDSVYISGFSCKDYYNCEIYKYSNVQKPY